MQGYPRYNAELHGGQLFVSRNKVPSSKRSVGSKPSRAGEENVLIKQLKPVLWLMRLMGLLPYTMAPSGEMEMKLFSWQSLYSLVIVTTAVGATVKMELQTFKNQDASFAKGLGNLAGITFYMPVLLIPFSHWPELRKKTTFYSSWMDLQTEYRMVTGKELILNLKKLVAFCLILTITVVGGFLAFVGGIYGVTTNLIPLVFASALNIVMPCTWITLCAAIMQTARSIASQLEQDFKRNCSMEVLQNYRHLWLRLSLITQDLGNSMGCTFGGQVISFFALQVLSGYMFIFSANLKTNLNVTAFGGFVFILMGSFNFLQCNSAHWATEQVGNMFMIRLQNLEEMFLAIVRETRNELRHFLDTMKRNDPVISYYGFVPVDRSLFVALSSAMVTYLVVLMQFQISSPEGDSKDSYNQSNIYS